MLQNMSLGSNGVAWMRSLRKISMRLYGTNLCLNCTSSTHFAVPCSNETLPNAPKHYEMLQNMSLVPMGWIECVLCEKFWCDFMAQTCALITLVQPYLHRVSCSNETLANAPKHYEMHQNMSLGTNGVDRVRSLPKIPMRVRGTNLCINSTSSARFCIEFCAVTKQSKMHPNTTKHTNSWV